MKGWGITSRDSVGLPYTFLTVTGRKKAVKFQQTYLLIETSLKATVLAQLGVIKLSVCIKDLLPVQLSLDFTSYIPQNLNTLVSEWLYTNSSRQLPAD